MKVTVVGLGKIGLPLAVQFAKMGKDVLGADINPETVDFVNRGVEPFPEEENLQEFLSEVVSSGNLQASTNTTECVAQSNVVVVVVPLFVNSNAEPDFRSMDAATEEIAKGLKKGTLVAYETTLPVGTTRNRFTKKLEEISRLRVGQDFHVVFSPERVLTGRVFSDLRKYPKIVGGVTDLCASKGLDFYSSVIEFDHRSDLPRPNGVWVLGSTESAEFVKLAETTYRDVNIGLANQFAKFADKLNLNIYDVIEAANSQPYSHVHQPGIAVGGHCIPIYPQFYLWGDPNASIVSEARKTNSGMPKYAMDVAAEKLASFEGKKILILGLAYRAGVKEDAFSGALDLLKLSAKIGCTTFVHDWMYSDVELLSRGMRPLARENYDSISLLIIQNSDVRNIQTLNYSFPNCELILDGRNLLASDENATKALANLTDAKVVVLGNFT
jgi:nucleotide sugar dehydrogenase